MRLFPEPLLQTVRSLNDHVLSPLKQSFVGKEDIIDLLGVALVARENLFLLGPPGTAKSAIVRNAAERLDCKVFDYLLTKFTEPNELFGPFDIRRLREGELVTNTEGMMPEADFIFLDELLNANSSILNSLLMALNERVFRRGRETRPLPVLMFVGASNRLPEDETLGALFDRFLLRVRCDNVHDDQLPQVLQAGWKLESKTEVEGSGVSIDALRSLQHLISSIDLSPVIPQYLELIRHIRRVGIPISDRRAVRLQRPIAASAILCERTAADLSDLWVLNHIWETQEQQEVLTGIVNSCTERHQPDESIVTHPQSKKSNRPDAESIAKAIDAILLQLSQRDPSVGKSPIDPYETARNQLSALTTQSQWVIDETQRRFLREKCDDAWGKLKSISESTP